MRAFAKNTLISPPTPTRQVLRALRGVDTFLEYIGLNFNPGIKLITEDY